MAVGESSHGASETPPSETPASELSVCRREASARRVRYRRIIDAAFGCLEAGEYDRVKVDEVARAAGVAKATLYRYFPSKEFLYSIVLREWVDEHHLRAIDADGAERARIRAHSIIGDFEKAPQFFRLTVALFSSADPDVKAELSAVSTRNHRYFFDDLIDSTPMMRRDAALILEAIVHSAVKSSVYHDVPFVEAYRLVDQAIDLLTGTAPTPVERGGGEQVAGSGSAARDVPGFKQRRRLSIVEHASDALREKAYEEIHVTTVARDSDVALGTLYRYFPSKESLYAEVLRHWISTSAFSSTLDHLAAEARIAARFDAVFDSLDSDPEFFRVNVLLHSVGDRSVQAVLGELAALARIAFARDLAALGVPNSRDVAAMTWALLDTLTTGVVYYGRGLAEARRVSNAFAELIFADGSTSSTPE
ncbi:TetR/AcrR family transcriptional regulator [Rhodococcoides yunnanense]|uniref:TetR/AcrR family transcriptional regulator n=1 Tax=Rhodococcoides yunnanense TaxID=278209 RepID=UPI000933452D|nr:TetR/AcrR family transcriptional regulator [Rhodococcus yunnanensis]